MLRPGYGTLVFFDACDISRITRKDLERSGLVWGVAATDLISLMLVSSMSIVENAMTEWPLKDVRPALQKEDD